MSARQYPPEIADTIIATIIYLRQLVFLLKLWDRFRRKGQE